MSFSSVPAVAATHGQSVTIVKAGHAAATANVLAKKKKRRRMHIALPYDPVALATAKAAGRTSAQSHAGGAANGSKTAPRATVNPPKVVKGFSGPASAKYSPSDSTGAVGKTRYIQLVNGYGTITDKNGGSIGSDTLAGFFDWPSATDVFDPQVIWDASTNRFYMIAVVAVSSTQHYLAYAFSKTDSPSGSKNFCKYAIGPIYLFPDYPKLGDTKNALLIGVNTFEGDEGGFIESDLYTIGKPPAGSACPDPDSMIVRGFGPLLTTEGDPAFTPVPANQIDGSDSGAIIGSSTTSGTELVLWKVASDAAGDVTLQDTNGIRIALPARYTFPQNAPQPGSASELDTLDGRLTQAVSAINPARSNKVSLWTQHTVSHPLTPVQPIVNGAEVRWYEINVDTNTLNTNGKLASQTRFYFNGSIAPDRAVDGSNAKFGDTMVLQASATATGILPTTSTSPRDVYLPQLFPSIFVVAKATGQAQSAPVTVFKGNLILDDFSCQRSGGTCRWGDYSGLTPDPTPPAGAKHGRLWGINELGDGPKGSEPFLGTWSTYSFIIDP
ncbi:MAG: hypothetical protein HY899_11225 [Deltaproteobacteria bacterium]|nr:hypothetical protein [Deltaproteobacteria bacterium]